MSLMMMGIYISEKFATATALQDHIFDIEVRILTN